MKPRKSNPSNEVPGRRPLDSIDSLRPSSLPPELASLEMNWDDDPHSAHAIDLLEDAELDIDAGERTTAIPDIPIDLLVRTTMAEADARENAESIGPTTADSNALEWSSPRSPPPAPPGRVEYPSAPIAAVDGHRNDEFLSDPLPTQPAPARQYAGRRTAATELFLAGMPSGAQPLSTSPPSRPSQPSARMDRNPSAPPTDRRPDTDNTRSLLKDRYATGDFSGALELAESILQTDPGDLEAQRFASSCRDVLTQMLASRIGSFEQIVVVALPPEELRWLTLDHRAGFFLSLVDGTLSIEELLDISGMARLESLRVLLALLDQRVLRLAR